MLRKIHGKKIILISLVFLGFILFEKNNLKNVNYNESDNIDFFLKIQSAIKNKEICEISYNESKTSAIVNVDCGSAIYINFKNKKTLVLIEHWPNVFTPIWLSDTVAVLDGPCGTGCAQGLLFIAPDKVVTCSEYNRENDDYIEDNPKSRTNRPLIVDPEREIYVCYDADNKIQVFPFPKVATIMPPKGYAPEQAEIIDDQLHMTYENQERESVVQVFSLK